MASLITVRLNKGDSPNWGFRLQGGKDFGTPLVIQKVNGGSPAERAGLIAGDSVIKINHVDVFNLLHKEAQDVIVKSGPNFDMVIQRGGSTWKPSVTPTGLIPKATTQQSVSNIKPVTKTSLAATNKSDNIGAIGTGHNLSAKPFAQVNGAVNGNPKLVNKQYNTPIKLYSDDVIAETLSAQTEVLSTGALGVNFKKNEKDYDASNSAVYRMLKEAENDGDAVGVNDAEPDAGIVTSPNRGIAGLKHIEAPQNRPAPQPSNPQLPPGQNICAECERLIVGVFVRIKDKNLHVECFKCATCGSSLKNVGYYNINNKLYCDIHAKSAAIAINNPTAVPITIPSANKAPVSAISAALSTHSLPSPSPLSPKTPGIAPSFPPPIEESTATPALVPSLSSTKINNNNTYSTSNNIINNNNNNNNSTHSLYNPSAPLSFSKYINKNSGPKPFSSVTAPLSPGGTLHRSAPLSPPNQYNKAPLSPSVPSFTSHSPSSTVGRKPTFNSSSGGIFRATEGRYTNITWPPPPPEDDNPCGVGAPTACPLFYPPPSKVEAQVEEKRQKDQSKFEQEYFTEENNCFSEDLNMDGSSSFYSDELCFSGGRRSATECVEILTETLDTQKLVENVIRSTPNLYPTTQSQVTNIYEEEKISSETKSSLIASRAQCTQNKDGSLRRPTDYSPNTIECRSLNRVENSVPQKWESSLTQALRTVPADPDTFCRIPSRGAASPMTCALTIAPAQPFNPQNYNTSEPVSLPEETEPYFPPEHPIVSKSEQPEVPADKPPAVPKPKSQFMKALEIAPENPFTPVGGAPVSIKPTKPTRKKDALDKLIDDLPRPNEKLDMRSALTTAPERSYTPLISEHSSSPDINNNKPKSSVPEIDRSLLIKPLKPEELPNSFKMNQKDPKPPSYYSPAVIEERIKMSSEDVSQQSENKERRIIEKETFQPAMISPQIIGGIEEQQNGASPCLPLFQGFTCSFKNKTDHAQFSVEVSTTPPIPTPPPKPQTPISYIATVEERPVRITKETIIEEKSDMQKTNVHQENIKCVRKQSAVRKQSVPTQKPPTDVQRQAEEIVQVKPLPVTTLLRKAEALPSYQKDLQATAEADLILMEKKQKAQERLEQQKRLREQESIQTQECKLQNVNSACRQQPVITVDQSDISNAGTTNFQPVYSDRPQSTTFSPRPRSVTPSMINKAPPLLPYYQDNLVPHYHVALESNVLDPTTPDISRSPSPHPDMRSRSPSPFGVKPRQERAKSPAQGPPPNPLKSLQPLPTPRDSKVKQAKENVQSYLQGFKSHTESGNRKSATTGVRVSDGGGGISEVGSKTVVCAVSDGNGHKEFMKCETQCIDSQREQASVAKKNEGTICTTNISEKSHQEQLMAQRQMQNQSVERSADGLTQVQRRKIVTEEFEQSHKETNIQIQKNSVTTNTRPFTKVNVPAVDDSSIKSVHITNPHHRSFESKEMIVNQQTKQEVNTQQTLQAASQKLTNNNASIPLNSESINSIQSQPTRHVFAPGTLASIKHVVPPCAGQKPNNQTIITKSNNIPKPDTGAGTGRQAGGISVAPKRGRGVLNTAALGGARIALCGHCHGQIRGPFITALGKIWCPQHFVCSTPSCKRPLQDLGFVEDKGQLYCEYCFEQYLAPPCSKCNIKIKGDCLKAIGKNFHPECFNCVYCGKLFANSPFFLEDGNPYCEADWNELFTTKCFACGFPVEAGDRWVEALNNNYHSQCFNCTMCKKNLEGQSFFAKGGRPFCKNHAR